MKAQTIALSVTILFIACGLISCKKYLDAKPDKSLAIPQTLGDFQALLDYYPVMNIRGVGAGENSSDDYYFTDEDWVSLSLTIKNMYIWSNDTDIFKPNYNNWQQAYSTIYAANTVINNIEKIKKDGINNSQWDNILGQALFFRANSMLQIVFVWCSAYDPATSKDELGIPLRLSTDFNIQSKRASLEKSYQQIISDLNKAIPLLATRQIHVLRPSKAAAYGLMARTYLSMRKYGSAELYADSSLRLDSKLMDYNDIDPSPSYPIPRYNEEVLFYGSCAIPSSSAKIDTSLIKSYQKNDLRKSLFFKDKGNGLYSFRGSYGKQISPFTGVATDEMYLIRSECEARAGMLDKAVNDLNTLLIKRWITGTYVPAVVTDQKDVLNLILSERRKELVTRGVRWMDIKRLNKEGANIILTRNINGKSYTLKPNANRYALPIPYDVIERSGMTQNPK